MKNTNEQARARLAYSVRELADLASVGESTLRPDVPDEQVLLEVLEQWVADEGVWEGTADGTRELLDILGGTRAGEEHDRQ